MEVAFQTHVLRLAFPSFEVKPHLCVIDKRYPVTVAETLDRFLLKRNPANPRERPEIVYRGKVADLKDSSLVCIRPVEDEVGLIMLNTAS